PFSIKKVISNVAYELELPSALKIYNVFHVSKLKKYIDGSSEFPSRRVVDRPAAQIVDDTGEEAWEVEEVVDKRMRKVGGRMIVLTRKDHGNQLKTYVMQVML